jgi:hypothetical protein
MGIFKFDDKIIKVDEWPYGWPDIQKRSEIKDVKIYFYHRYTSPQSYDTSLISMLEYFGFTVDYANDLPESSYRAYDVLIIGAPSTGDTALGATEISILQNKVVIPVFSLCRNTSRYRLLMANGSTTRSSNALRKLIDHEGFYTKSGADVTFTSTNTNQEISSFINNTVLVYNNSGNSAGTGLAYRVVSKTQIYVHLSNYYNFGYQETDEFRELIKNTFEYLSYVKRYGVKNE